LNIVTAIIVSNIFFLVSGVRLLDKPTITAITTIRFLDVVVLNIGVILDHGIVNVRIINVRIINVCIVDIRIRDVSVVDVRIRDIRIIDILTVLNNLAPVSDPPINNHTKPKLTTVSSTYTGAGSSIITV